MEEIKKAALAQREALIRCRRRLHGFAECGFSLPKTIDFVKNTLQNMGYDPQDCGKGGIVCEVGDPHAPAVLLRADMDALPLREETRLPFRAENGHMHACGHDMHTAMLLGAAALLKEREGALPTRVRFAFQSAEELLLGASEMCASGVLEGAFAALMLHTVPAIPYPTGTLLLPPTGVGAPAAYFFCITVRGKSAHVGMPQMGIDALKAAVTLYEVLTKAAKEQKEGFSLRFGQFLAGDAPNILPQKAELSGSFRSLDGDAVRHFQEVLLHCAAEVEARERCQITVAWRGACPPLQNSGRVKEIFARALSRESIAFLQTESSSSAAEDFSVIAARVPAIAVAIAAGEKGRGYEHPLHHPAVLFDEDALAVGAAAYTVGALSLGEEAHTLQTFTSPAFV